MCLSLDDRENLPFPFTVDDREKIKIKIEKMERGEKVI
jgi:hypothetical protein